MLPPEDISFINFLYKNCIPFAFGLRFQTFKTILCLYITDFIYINIYIPWFYKTNTNVRCHIYPEQRYTTVVKSLHQFQMFNIIVPYNYTDDLKFCTKQNREQDTIIFLVKNTTIQKLDTFKPKVMFKILSQ